MTKKMSKLITYLSILQETLKFKEQEEINTRYADVDIELPDDFIIHERWSGQETGFSEQKFHVIEFLAKDIDKRIKSARDHLRYLKHRKNGAKYGE
jgi:hypothetical protein